MRAIPLGVDDGEYRACGTADQNEALFAVILAVVQPFDGKRVFEDFGCQFETDAVLGVVLGTLGLTLFKVIALHIYTDYP